jgi:hypothetical protein
MKERRSEPPKHIAIDPRVMGRCPGGSADYTFDGVMDVGGTFHSLKNHSTLHITLV